jgi:phosphoglycolate phosphatase
MKLPQAIIFDWDNTIIESSHLIFAALNSTFAQFNLPALSEEQFRSEKLLSLREAFPQIFGDDWHKARDHFYQAYNEAQGVQGVKILPGAYETLAQLKAQGIYLAVVSNKNGQILRAEAKDCGLFENFTIMVGSGDVESDKPSPIPVLHALANGGLKPSHDTWFVGDNQVDYECAISAGCLPIIVGIDPVVGNYTRLSSLKELLEI